MKTDRSVLFLSIFISFFIHIFLITSFRIVSPCSKFPKSIRISFFRSNDRSQSDSGEGSLKKGKKTKNKLLSKKAEMITPPAVLQTSFLSSSKPKSSRSRGFVQASYFEKKNFRVFCQLQTQRQLIRMHYPQYPLWAQKAGIQVDVVVKFQILKTGRIGTLFIEKFSGRPEMDVLVLRAVRLWKFEALPKDNGESFQWGSATLKFRLNAPVNF